MALYAFLVGCLFLPALSLRGPANVTVSDVAFLGSAVALGLADKRAPLTRNGAWRVAAYITVVGALLALYRADSAVGSLAITVRLMYLLLVFQWQARRLLVDRRRMEQAFLLIGIGGGISGLVAFAQGVLHVLIGLGGYFYGRAFGLTQQPNDAGATMSLALVVSFGIALQMPRRRWLPIATGLLSGIGLIFSGSITGMMAAAIGLFVLGVRYLRNPRQLVLGVLAVVVAVAVAVEFQAKQGAGAAGGNPLQRFTVATGGGTAANGNTLKSRLQTDQAAWRDIVSSPWHLVFGRGLDPSSTVVIPAANVATHNFVLLTFLAGGFVLVLGLTVAIVASLRVQLRRRKGGWSGLHWTVLGSSATALVFAMTAPVFYDRFFWFPLVAGLCFSRDAVAGLRQSAPAVGPADGRGAGRHI